MSYQNRRHVKKLKIHFIQRQEVWLPTIWGWLVIALSLVILLTLGISNLPPFLAVTQPINAEVLVVEGWVPDDALKQAVIEFNRGSYRQVITTGIPLERGFYLAEYQSYANLAAASLKKLGLEPEKVVSVPCPEVDKDRTYASAVALRQWLSEVNLPLKSINLFTLDVHARRSWLLFQKALASEIQVGVIAASPVDYDPKHWWRYSTGVRKVMSEFIGYVYARLISWNAF